MRNQDHADRKHRPTLRLVSINIRYDIDSSHSYRREKLFSKLFHIRYHYRDKSRAKTKQKKKRELHGVHSLSLSLSLSLLVRSIARGILNSLSITPRVANNGIVPLFRANLARIFKEIKRNAPFFALWGDVEARYGVA